MHCSKKNKNDLHLVDNSRNKVVQITNERLAVLGIFIVTDLLIGV